eukprot:30803-Pelagococcus_subviridis.AAC.4
MAELKGASRCVGIETEGRAERCAGRESPQGTAFTARMGTYGDQCEENAPEPNALETGPRAADPFLHARCATLHPASMNSEERRRTPPGTPATRSCDGQCDALMSASRAPPSPSRSSRSSSASSKSSSSYAAMCSRLTPLALDPPPAAAA